MTENRDVYLLKIRDLIADKEVVIENMKRDQANGGWSVDWNKALQPVDSELANYFALVGVV